MSTSSDSPKPLPQLLVWAKQQPWWPCIEVLLVDGLVVSLHVPVGMMPPGDKCTLRYPPSGGRVEITLCENKTWHVVSAVHHLVHEAAVEVVEALKEAHVQRDSLTRPSFGRHAPEVGEA